MFKKRGPQAFRNLNPECEDLDPEIQAWPESKIQDPSYRGEISALWARQQMRPTPGIYAKQFFGISIVEFQDLDVDAAPLDLRFGRILL